MKSALILFAIIYVASSVTIHQVTDCIGATCALQVKDCMADERCNASLECYKLCNNTDTTCTHECFIPVQDVQAFWELDLCAMNCMAVLEMKENDPIRDCDTQQCGRFVEACVDDQECMKGASCIGNCERTADYSCAAECIVDNIENKNLFNLIHCDQKCLTQFITLQ